ncbi:MULTISPECIES: NB-ARC domain-containing protein [Kamptonema]|uniref:NB-ARC domain-containing protein n=1 Tax=Kamptonema TaxID=1501433 RepID=UPI0001DACE32|nr:MULTISPECIES: NB-ARC domain-containing protein [Kamptonema]CBN58189.1 putative WD-repeat protein [Kamptonema sp. PCC 6506]
MTAPKFMELEESVKWIDDEIFAKTGKRLDSLQISILEATSQGKKYPEIAEDYKFSNDHVRKAAWKLWKLLSDVLGENVSQSNFRSFLKRIEFSNNHIVNSINNSKINVCSDRCHSEVTKERSPTSPQNSQQTPKQLHIDLSDAPDSNIFYNRTSELTTLKQWIVEDRTRLITILGLSGIGKTALAIQLIEQIKTEFDYIIYRSLHNTPTLQTLETNLIQFLSRGGAPVPAPEERATTGGLPLLEYLRSYRCLVILDDVQMIFSSGQLAGNYQPGYENYGTFFKQLAESSHHSCLILLSWEKPREIVALESQNQACRTLQLNGLGTEAQEILREKGLLEPERWLELIDIYQGNPSWLNIVGAMIQDLFNGSVSELLSYDTLFLGDLEPLLQQHFHRLSDSEKKVMSWLASEVEPIEISKSTVNLELSPSELLKNVQSLGRRCLIKKIKQGERTLFTLQPVFREYIKNLMLSK